MPVSIFTCPDFSNSPILQSSAIPRSFTVFGEWAQLSGVLVLYGTYGAHNDRMMSFVSAEPAYLTVP